jgi:aconitase A
MLYIQVRFYLIQGWKQYFLERLEKYLLKSRNRHGGYLLHQIEQEMKLIDESQILSNLHNNITTDPLTIAGNQLLQRKARDYLSFSFRSTC